MLKQFSTIIATIAVLSASLAGLFTQPVYAVDVLNNPACKDNAADICDKNEKNQLMPSLKGWINVALVVAGILAVIYIIFGGIKYVLSAGEQQKVAQAKNIIVYASVGLLIAILAFVIVNFVVMAIK